MESLQPSLSDDHRALDPPDPIPNSEVKQCIADGSVVFRHVRVGHRQAFIEKERLIRKDGPFFLDKCSVFFSSCQLHVTAPAP